MTIEGKSPNITGIGRPAIKFLFNIKIRFTIHPMKINADEKREGASPNQ